MSNVKRDSMESKNGERLAALEADVQNVQKNQDTMQKSIDSLHGKFDLLQQMLGTNYVAKDTFEEYRKNRWLERVVVALITAVLSLMVGLIIIKSKGI